MFFLKLFHMGYNNSNVKHLYTSSSKIYVLAKSSSV